MSPVLALTEPGAPLTVAPSAGQPARTVRTMAAGGSVEHTYIFTRDLGPTPYGSHHLVLSAEHHTSHLLHRLHRAFPTAALPMGVSPSSHADGQPRAPHTLAAATLPSPAAVRDRFEKAMRKLQRADHPHILQIEEFGWDEPGTGGIGPFVISDYTGDADGIVTLDRLVKLKGGWLTLEEAKRAIEQLMEACAAAHAAPAGSGGGGTVCHGTLSMSQVHVDRRGSLLIELYGLHELLAPPPLRPRNPCAEEVRSIAAIGYQLATGLLPIKPVIPVEHILQGVDQTWRDYFHTGLGIDGGVGFASAAHALAAVRGLRIAGGGGIHEVGTSLRDLLRSMLTPVR